MGDFVLMKKHLITHGIAIAVATVLMAEIDLSWVDKQIKAIKPKRVGIDNRYISNLDNPILLKEVEREEEEGDFEFIEVETEIISAETPLKL